jgi:hypothetical protein
MAYLRTRVLLSLGVLLMASLASRADTVPLDKLTEALLQERVRLFLETKEGETLMVAVLPLVRVRVEQIRYTARAGKPVRLEWQYVPIGKLTAAQIRIVEETLQGVFKQVFGNFMGGLISDVDAAVVLKLINIQPSTEFAPPPPIAPAPTAPSVPPAKLPPPRSSSKSGGATPGPSTAPATVPVLRLGIAWSYGCTGCYVQLLPVYFYYYSYETSPSAGLGGTSSATATPASRPRQLDRDTYQEQRAIILARLYSVKEPVPLYWRARSFYWQGDAEMALALLIRATELNPQDARYWYFRALAERALGEMEMAKDSARRAAAWKVLRRPDETEIGLALERVQGAERRFLNEAIGEPLTPESASQIARAPVPRQNRSIFPSSSGASSTEVESSR